MRMHGGTISSKTVGRGSRVRVASSTVSTRVGNANPLPTPSLRLRSGPGSKGRSKNLRTGMVDDEHVEFMSQAPITVRKTHRDDVADYDVHEIKHVKVPTDLNRTAGRVGERISLENRRIGGGSAPTIRRRRRQLIMGTDDMEMEIGNQKYVFTLVKPPKNKRK
jgi:hypothetical protein